MAVHHQDHAELNQAGIDTRHHDELLALKPQAQARGLDWSKVLEAVRKYGPAAIEIVTHLIGGGTQPQATQHP